MVGLVPVLWQPGIAIAPAPACIRSSGTSSVQQKVFWNMSATNNDSSPTIRRRRNLASLHAQNQASDSDDDWHLDPIFAVDSVGAIELIEPVGHLITRERAKTSQSK